MLIGFEYAFLGGSLGVAEGTRIARAFAIAAERHLPVLSVAASGGARMQEGTSALVQMQVIAGAIGAARDAGIPHIAVAGDPTTGGVWASLVAGADVAGAKVPVTSVVIGEGVSGGAIALAAPDRLWLAPAGFLAVIAPEYATSILKLPASAVRQVADRLRLRPADLIGRGIARGLAVPPVPPGEGR